MIIKRLLALNFWRYNIYWVLWLCLITWLSNKEPSSLPKISLLAFPHADKLVHAVFYFNLFLLAVWGFKAQHQFANLKTFAFSRALIFSLLWGALMELSQLWIFTYRSADIKDMMANTFGVIIGIFVFLTIQKMKKVKLFALLLLFVSSSTLYSCKARCDCPTFSKNTQSQNKNIQS